MTKALNIGVIYGLKKTKVEEVRDAMESEVRTQLLQQAAGHTDHLQDILRAQEQELKHEFQQDLSEKLTEQKL